MKSKLLAVLIFFVSTQLGAQTKTRVVEEIVARVNNEIITRSDLERARAEVEQEARQECQNCAPQQLQALIAEKQKNVLRDLIDQSLLVQRAKDLSINVDTDVTKRLDQLRQQNNLKDMDELEKKIRDSGLDYEDFKNSIRNNLLTQEVIRSEVGRNIIISREEIQKYYDEHKNDFVRPEQIYLREIFVSTEGKKESELPDLEKKANNLLDRVRKGEDFAELAKRYSDGNSAPRGGELPAFERSQLSKELADVVFKMNRGQMTDVIRTKQGFLILKVEQRYDAGLQPVDKVEGEISNRIYEAKMEPGLRNYLKTLRQDSYVVVKPGYVDSAAVASTPIQEVAPVNPEDEKERKGKKKFLLFGKRKTAS